MWLSSFCAEEEIYDKFKKALITKTELLKVGDPKDSSSNLGAVVSEQQYE